MARSFSRSSPTCVAGTMAVTEAAAGVSLSLTSGGGCEMERGGGAPATEAGAIAGGPAAPGEGGGLDEETPPVDPATGAELYSTVPAGSRPEKASLMEVPPTSAASGRELAGAITAALTCAATASVSLRKFLYEKNMISNKGGMDMPICGGTEDMDLLFFVKIYDIPV